MFNQSQQEKYKKQRLELQKYSEQDISEKQRRVNGWIERNPGYKLDNLKENISKMHIDVFALSEAFLEIYDILHYIYHLKTESRLIDSYFDQMKKLGFDNNQLAFLINESKRFQSDSLRLEVSCLIRKDIDTMKFMIHFIADNTKITEKKGYEEFDEEE